MRRAFLAIAAGIGWLALIVQLHLAVEQVAEEVTVGPAVRGGLLADGIEVLAGDGQAEPFQMGNGLLFEYKRAHAATSVS